MKKGLLFFLLLITAALNNAYSQISVTNTLTPEQMVEGILLGNGVVATNITYNNSAVNAGTVQNNISFFESGTSGFPIASGVLLTTGGYQVAIGPNNATGQSMPGSPDVSTDPDLNAIAGAGNDVTTGVFLEFDFVPQGDSLSFRYMFASEEYPEFAPPNGGVNDVFGFFISGPGISGPYENGAINIAVIPGTSIPITINNVNAVTNQAYYVNNQFGAAYGTAIEYDGTTTLLTAAATVQCGETYHIKMAISNIQDSGWDSGVFLEADSFTSEAVEISVATVTGDTTVVEGCTDATFIFTRPQTQIGDSLEVTYDIAGDAAMGTDFNNLPNPVIFLPGEDTIVVTLTPVADGIAEPTELVTITATTITECGDTIVSTGTIYIIDEPFLSLEFTNPTTVCLRDSVPVPVTPDGGLPPYTYQWENGQTSQTGYLDAAVLGPNEYQIIATDACGFSITDTVIVTGAETLQIDSLTMTPTMFCISTGSVQGYSSGGVAGAYSYQWTDASGVHTSSSSVMNNLPPGEYFLTVTNSGCLVTDSIDVTELPPVTLTFAPNDTVVACASSNVPITSIPTNGQAPYTYDWEYNNQTTWPAYVPATVNFTTVYYPVSVTDACGQTGMDTIGVTLNYTLSIDSLTSNPTTSCGNTGNVHAYVSGGTGPSTYLWSNETGTITATTTTMFNLPAGTYEFTVTNSGCFETGTVVVDQLPSIPLTFAPNDTLVKCPNDSVPITSIPTNGVGPYSYQWQYNNQTSWPAYVPMLVDNTTTEFIVVVTDACGAIGTDTIAVTLDQTLEIDTILVFNATSCEPTGAVSGILTGQTGAVDYNWTGPNANPGPFNQDASVLEDIPSGWYYFSATDAVCSVSDSAFVGMENPPIAQFSATVLSGCSPLTITFVNESQNTNFYHWDFGNGQTLNTADYGNQTITFEDDAIVRLISDAGACNDTFMLPVTISVCGCMDPIALNYNPLAEVPTNDCIYPIPTVIVPNVFTPNADATNDFFELRTTNATSVKITVLNRWGGILFEETGVSPKWDGTDSGGNEMEDGVYFYKYLVTGMIPDSELEGHGFVHLVRDGN